MHVKTGGDSLMTEQEFGTFLGALRAVSLDTLASVLELLGEVFGPPPTGKTKSDVDLRQVRSSFRLGFTVCT